VLGRDPAVNSHINAASIAASPEALDAEAAGALLAPENRMRSGWGLLKKLLPRKSLPLTMMLPSDCKADQPVANF